MEKQRYCPDCYKEVEYIVELDDTYSCGDCEELFGGRVVLTFSQLEKKLAVVEVGAKDAL